jgi:hypothetical protein
MYKLTLSDEAQVTLLLRVSVSDLVYRHLAGPPLQEEGGRGVELKTFIHRDPNPLSEALISTSLFEGIQPFFDLLNRNEY